MEKEKALSLALSQIEKQFGRGAIMRLGQAQRQEVPAISTGALALAMPYAAAFASLSNRLKWTAPA